MRFLLLIIVMFGAFLPVSTVATTVNAVNYDVSSLYQTQISILSDNLLDATIFTIPGENERLVVDLDVNKVDLKGGTFKAGQTYYAGEGHIKNLRVAKRGDGRYRFVFDLSEGAQFHSDLKKNDGLGFLIKGQSQPQKSMPKTVREAYNGGPRYFGGQTPFPRMKPLSTYIKPRKNIIVIDPGHGGRDPGAIGINGTHEKKITLASAKELKVLLEKTGRYEVLLTRTGDSYIEHEARIRLARLKNADLFISIHADSTASSKARGASVYTLADRAQKRSKGIVENQNWIMDVDLSAHSDPVGDILVDLAQRKTKSQSDVFAKKLLSEISKSTHLVGNSHRRAGYFVLLAPDVPAVLLELGFLSNPGDEKLLNSDIHRTKVLKRVVTAIDEYFKHQKQ